MKFLSQSELNQHHDDEMPLSSAAEHLDGARLRALTALLNRTGTSGSALAETWQTWAEFNPDSVVEEAAETETLVGSRPRGQREVTPLVRIDTDAVGEVSVDHLDADQRELRDPGLWLDVMDYLDAHELIEVSEALAADGMPPEKINDVWDLWALSAADGFTQPWTLTEEAGRRYGLSEPGGDVTLAAFEPGEYSRSDLNDLQPTEGHPVADQWYAAFDMPAASERAGAGREPRPNLGAAIDPVSSPAMAQRSAADGLLHASGMSSTVDLSDPRGPATAPAEDGARPEARDQAHGQG